MRGENAKLRLREFNSLLNLNPGDMHYRFFLMQDASPMQIPNSNCCTASPQRAQIHACESRPHYTKKYFVDMMSSGMRVF